MKKSILRISLMSLFFAMAIFMVSCGGDGHTHDADGNHVDETSTVDKTGPEYTSAYICPMHCKGSGSATEGKCPDCGMAYVKNEAKAAEGHEGHDHGSHEGHDHGSHEGHNH